MLKNSYSTKKLSPVLLNEIKEALKNVAEFGSIEIYVQNSSVTQITIRKIKKTNGFLSKNRQNITDNGLKKD